MQEEVQRCRKCRRYRRKVNELQVCRCSGVQEVFRHGAGVKVQQMHVQVATMQVSIQVLGEQVLRVQVQVQASAGRAGAGTGTGTGASASASASASAPSSARVQVQVKVKVKVQVQAVQVMMLNNRNFKYILWVSLGMILS